jgi:hypothetical protein
MTAMFNDLMTGLDEVDAFLLGQRTNYKITLPTPYQTPHLPNSRPHAQLGASCSAAPYSSPPHS